MTRTMDRTAFLGLRHRCPGSCLNSGTRASVSVRFPPPRQEPLQSHKEVRMNIGEPIRELEVEPLLYPAGLPEAPAEPTPSSIPESDPVEVPA